MVSLGSCNIKGNISTGGERIYHVPGQTYYDVTRIDESAGERWFWSEAEARSAGWQRSKR
ncbi:sunset domain-containing protein [Mesorhizobium caraganae]|uniref:sunset domain-containing protein n=1 Tax=Mesorhizobium caraganae TaxID=483206 RepID=UPI003F5076DD